MSARAPGKLPTNRKAEEIRSSARLERWCNDGAGSNFYRWNNNIFNVYIRKKFLDRARGDIGLQTPTSTDKDQRPAGTSSTCFPYDISALASAHATERGSQLMYQYIILLR